MELPQISSDPDTDRLLGVVVWILTRFFGHDTVSGLSAVRVMYPCRDDDFYHHEGAFRSAALIHYAVTHGQQTTFEGFHEWLFAQDLHEAEAEALEYFRDHYFQDGRP